MLKLFNNFNINNYSNWDNNNKNNNKKFIIILFIFILLLLSAGIIYKQKLSKNAILSDEEYIQAKEEYQKELNDKKANYTFYEKVTYGEKINAVIVNSSLRNINAYIYAQDYPFEPLYTYFIKHNSNSSIFEINTESFENISSLLNDNSNIEDDNNSEKSSNYNLFKTADLIILSYNTKTEAETEDSFENLINTIHSKNEKAQIFVVFESGNNNTKIDKLKNTLKKDSIIYIDIKDKIKKAEESDIQCIKNNSKSNNQIYEIYSNSISDTIENLN